MVSTPKYISASQPCKPVSMEQSSQKPKRGMSTSPEIVQGKEKVAKGYTRESFLKKPTSNPGKQGRKGKN